jgi:hypothetical protein
LQQPRDLALIQLGRRASDSSLENVKKTVSGGAFGVGRNVFRPMLAYTQSVILANSSLALWRYPAEASGERNCFCRGERRRW